MFLGFYSVLLCCSICWHRSVSSIFLGSFFSFNISCDFSLISDLIYLSSLFFLLSLDKNIKILFIFSKKALSFIDLFYFFLVSILFIFILIFIISFLLPFALFVLVSLVPLDIKLDYFSFFLFLEEGLYCYKLYS